MEQISDYTLCTPSQNQPLEMQPATMFALSSGILLVLCRCFNDKDVFACVQKQNKQIIREFLIKNVVKKQKKINILILSYQKNFRSSGASEEFAGFPKEQCEFVQSLCFLVVTKKKLLPV